MMSISHEPMVYFNITIDTPTRHAFAIIAAAIEYAAATGKSGVPRATAALRGRP